MKKNLLAVLLFALSLSAFSQSESPEKEMSMQVMVPRDVFIGDSGQIQFSFRNPVDIFAFADQSLIKDETIHLNLEPQDFLENPQECYLKSAVLIRNGVNYNLCITFIPWTTGTIKFKDFYLEKILARGGKPEKTAEENLFPISLESVTILSLTEKLNTTTLRPPKEPLTLPKTNYVLLLFLFLATGLMSLLFIVLMKLPVILRWLRNFRKKISYHKNSMKTRLALNSLLKKETEDKIFAEKWQQTMRQYLNFRFGTSFASTTDRKIRDKIEDITGNLCNDSIDECLGKLESHFIRTNYIRFASGSIDSKLLPAQDHEAKFLDGEKSMLVESTVSIVNTLEKGVE